MIFVIFYSSNFLNDDHNAYNIKIEKYLFPIDISLISFFVDFSKIS